MPGLEHKVEAAVMEHLRLIQQCLNEYVEFVRAYLKGDEPTAKKQWERVDRIEHEADEQRREIERLLYGGAFLPLTREDLAQFAEAADRVADAAEASSDTLWFTRPEVPDEFDPGVQELAEKAVSMMPLLVEAAQGLFADFQDTIQKASEIDAGEHQTDEIELGLTEQVFASRIELAHKLQLRSAIREIARISDRMEDASDRLEALAVKKAL